MVLRLRGRLRRGRLFRRGSGGSWREATPAARVLAVLVGGPVAALPPPGVSTVMVLFEPGTTASDARAAMRAVDGRLLWNDPSGELWAFDLGSGGDAAKLYRHGARLVSSSLLPVGCFNWSRA